MWGLASQELTLASMLLLKLNLLLNFTVLDHNIFSEERCQFQYVFSEQNQFRIQISSPNNNNVLSGYEV